MTTGRNRPRGSPPRANLPTGPSALLIADAEETAVLEPLLKAANLSVTRRTIATAEFDLENFLIELEDGFEGPLARTSLAVVAADLLVDARLDIINLVDELLEPGRPLLVSCTQAGATEQAVLCQHPQRVVGIGILGLLGGHRVLEIAPAFRSDDATVQRVVSLFEQGGAQVHRVQDTPGLVLARILAPVVNEAAFALTDAGASAEAVDTAMRLGAGYPFGPLRWADDVGLHRILLIMEYLARSLDGERYRPAPMLRQLALSGLTGRAVGRGFFHYAEESPAGGARRPRPG